MNSSTSEAMPSTSTAIALPEEAGPAVYGPGAAPYGSP